MNRLLTLPLIGLAGLLASCGTSVNSSTQPGTRDEYTVAVTPDQFTLNAGDWASIVATVDLSFENSAAKPISPQPTIKFSTSDPNVTVSPAGEVCAGQWDSKYLTCTATPGLSKLMNPNTYVTVTAYNADHNVSQTTRLSIHPRAATISLYVNPSDWTTASAPSGNCISQNPPNNLAPGPKNQVQYFAKVLDANGTDISSEINQNDYTWSVADTNIAAASEYGYVIARNPGVTSVYAQLNGTVSAPLTFVTCPPASIVLASSPYTNGTPIPPYSATDLTSICDPSGNVCEPVSKGSQAYMTASLLDTNGNPIVISPLNYITTDTLAGTFSTVLPLTSKLAANTSGRFSVMASCEPGTCNASVADFILPNQTAPTPANLAGFNYPIYSNVIGVTVQGTTGSTVLVTGSQFPVPVTASDGTQVYPHVLYTYDSESLTLTHTIQIGSVPNSMVVSPDGTTAYIGSDGNLALGNAGLVVVNLTSFQSSLRTYPIAGGISTDVISGKVLGVSPNSRYVLISDTSDPNPANQFIYLIDTTQTKVATRYNIPGINAVTFAADDSNFWIGGSSGVYVFQADTFVPISNITSTDINLSTNVKALAWMPDGQSYFASGDQIVNYSTCDSKNPVTLAGNPLNLDTTTIAGVPHAMGLSGNQWYDYSVTTSAQIVGTKTAQAISSITSGGSGNVCTSKITVNTPAPVTSTLKCNPTQVRFLPTLESEFVTGVDPACTAPESAVHGYDLNTQAEILLTTNNPVIPLSGGVLNDGRYLYFGSSDGTTNGTLLHRIDLTAGGENLGNNVIAPAVVPVVPTFVAVVPK